MASYPSISLSLACEHSRRAAREVSLGYQRFSRQNVPGGQKRKEMAVFAGYSVSLWRNSAVACVQTHPSPQKKIGDDGESQTSLSLIFFWGEGDVCTQTIRLKFKREKISASSQVLNSLSSTSLNSFQRELFTCLFQRLLRLNRMAKFYPPNWIWKNLLRQRSTKGNGLGARKNLNSSRPLGRQLSHLLLARGHILLVLDYATAVTTARANQKAGLANGRAAKWEPEIVISPFRALSRCQLTFPFCC